MGSALHRAEIINTAFRLRSYSTCQAIEYSQSIPPKLLFFSSCEPILAASFVQAGARSRRQLRAAEMTSQGFPPASARLLEAEDENLVCLELEDGVTYQGYSFGAAKSIAGELVFQTGMVGYPESITDPSYRGQILVITFPLVGNYGVPSRDTVDDLLGDLPAHFESSQIHVAGLVAASYSGEDYSHYLAQSSLGTWLKEQGIPAMYGVDTRALTKRIRQKGSMLGRMLFQRKDFPNGTASVNGQVHGGSPRFVKDWQPYFDAIDWVNPNQKNLVAEGEF